MEGCRKGRGEGRTIFNVPLAVLLGHIFFRVRMAGGLTETSIRREVPKGVGLALAT